MDFTFGIVTSKLNPLIDLKNIINSIINLKIPNYEIIIIGGNQNFQSNNLTICSFEENPKGGWITKKKNIITKMAKYENIVYMHDYIIFDINWYKNFLKFGNNFDVCMNKILNSDNTRYRDWCFFTRAEKVGFCIPDFLIPYEFKFLSKLMYFSGAYWVAKKRVMEEFPLNENLFWNQAEDIDWSNRVTEKYNFSINKKSIVKLTKYKDKVWNDVKDLEKLKKINDSKEYHNLNKKEKMKNKISLKEINGKKILVYYKNNF